MGEKISLHTSAMSEEAKIAGLENQIQKQGEVSKNVFILASDIEAFRLNQIHFPWSENIATSASLGQRVKALGAGNLSSSARNVIRTAQTQLDHLNFGLEFPIVMDVDPESPLPNFARNLLTLAGKIEKAEESEYFEMFEEELDPVQKREILQFVDGKMSRGTLVQAIKTYLQSLRDQAFMAETLHQDKYFELARSVLETMESRMI